MGQDFYHDGSETSDVTATLVDVGFFLASPVNMLRVCLARGGKRGVLEMGKEVAKSSHFAKISHIIHHFPVHSLERFVQDMPAGELPVRRKSEPELLRRSKSQSPKAAPAMEPSPPPPPTHRHLTRTRTATFTPFDLDLRLSDLTLKDPVLENLRNTFTRILREETFLPDKHVESLYLFGNLDDWRISPDGDELVDDDYILRQMMKTALRPYAAMLYGSENWDECWGDPENPLQKTCCAEMTETIRAKRRVTCTFLRKKLGIPNNVKVPCYGHDNGDENASTKLSKDYGFEFSQGEEEDDGVVIKKLWANRCGDVPANAPGAWDGRRGSAAELAEKYKTVSYCDWTNTDPQGSPWRVASDLAPPFPVDGGTINEFEMCPVESFVKSKPPAPLGPGEADSVSDTGIQDRAATTLLAAR